MISEPHSEEEQKFACTPRRFAMHMNFLRSARYNIIDLKDLEDFISGRNTIPDRSVAITIDDGFLDNYTNALPTLQKYDIPATIFLTAGMMEKTNLWMQTRGFPRRDMLNWRQVKEMSQMGISFGAHTMTHPRLPELSEEKEWLEIEKSKGVIENHLGHGINYLAYPYGLFTGRTCLFAKDSGFSMACSTRSGFNNEHTDPFRLRRIEVYGTDRVLNLFQKITFGINDSSVSVLLRYYWGRMREHLIQTVEQNGI